MSMTQDKTMGHSSGGWQDIATGLCLVILTVPTHCLITLKQKLLILYSGQSSASGHLWLLKQFSVGPLRLSPVFSLPSLCHYFCLSLCDLKKIKPSYVSSFSIFNVIQQPKKLKWKTNRKVYGRDYGKVTLIILFPFSFCYIPPPSKSTGIARPAVHWIH